MKGERHTVFPAVSTTPFTAPPAVFATPPPTPCMFAMIPWAFSRCSGGMLDVTSASSLSSQVVVPWICDLQARSAWRQNGGGGLLWVIGHGLRLAQDIALAFARQDVQVDDAVFGDFHCGREVRWVGRLGMTIERSTGEESLY